MTGNKEQLSTGTGGDDLDGSVEDISLSDLFLVFGRQRKLIFGVIFAGTAAATLIAFFLPLLYRSESVILPPRSLYVERLTAPGLYEITADDLYTRVVRNLRSSELRYRFFVKNNLFEKLRGKNSEAVSEYGIFQEKFDEMIQVEKSSGKDEGDDFITVTMDGAKPELLSVWLTDFIDFVDKYTVQNVTDAMLEKMHRRQVRLQSQINGLRNIARNKRQDRVARLKESAAIAEQLGISGDLEYLYPYCKKGNEDRPVIVIGKENPEYLRGSEALLAEAERLKGRKSDDPFIEDLRGLQEQLSSLTRQQVQPRGEVHALRIDQRAVTLEDPIWPNRLLIVAIGFVCSLFFGGFVGFIKDWTEMKRSKGRPAN